MKLIFCTSNKIGAAVIRGVTWSEYSHVAIIDGDKVIEAAWPRVRVRSLDDVIRTNSRYSIVDIPCQDESAAIKSAYSQVGKPYDWTAIIGIFFHRDWQEDDSWFCSELVAWCLLQGGTALFRKEVMNRITPHHLWMLH